ncbi:MAG TPA: protein kinase, partial [Thermoanaerobaculia bacterium]
MIHTKLSNRYEVVGELGRGGMGVVYRARDPVLNREVAVKLMSSSDLSPELEERFQREAQVVGQMDHPSIVPIHD